MKKTNKQNHLFQTEGVKIKEQKRVLMRGQVKIKSEG